MYDKTRVRANMSNIVGWRSPKNPDYPTLVTSVTDSDSGLYYEDQYPFLGVETIDSIAEDFDNFGLGTWSNLVAYVTGDKIIYSGHAYQAIKDGTGKQPGVETTYWKLLLEVYLQEQSEQCIIQVIDRMITEKKLNGSTRSLMEHRILFEGTAGMNETIIKEGRFVGLKITPHPRLGLKLVLHNIGLQFTQTQTDLRLYLFHSSRLDAVATLDATTTVGGKSFEWVVLDKELFFVNQDTTAANQRDTGCYFVGYFEDDVSGQALNKDYDWSKEPSCDNCNKDMYNRVTWNLYNKYFKVEPIEVNANDLNGIQLWNMDNVQYTRQGNYGLNLSVSVQCDMTDILIQQKAIFSQAVIKQMAVNILRLIVWTNRQNKIEGLSKKEAVIELKGVDGTKSIGLEAKLDKEIRAIDIDLSGLDSPCFNKSPNKGIRRGTW